MNKERILFLNFNCIWCPHYETDLEIMSKLKDNGHNVYALYCNGAMGNYCISGKCNKDNNCKQCFNTLKNGYDAIGLKHSHRFKLKSISNTNFPTFNTIEELKQYNINGINLGLGAASSFMSVSRDCFFNPSEHKKEIDGLLNAAYTVMVNVEHMIEKLDPHSIYLFNGRFAEYNPVLELCVKRKIDFYIHERGANAHKYQVIKNEKLHSYNRYKKEIIDTWDNEKDANKKVCIAKQWFYDRRNKVELNWISFVTDQESSRLPNNFDHEKNNIAIFNSSMDEYGVFEEWINPIDKNDNNILRNIVEHFKNDKHKHFYLRIHPNLKDVDTSQMQEIKNLSDKKYPNLTIIWPEESVDSYALMDNCEKTLTFASTIGIEAAYWGKPTILAGISIYDNFDCVYKAEDYNKLYNLIDSDLQPKPSENCLKYAYWQNIFGIPFEKFEPIGLFNGKFSGIDLHRKRKNIFRRIYKKIKSKFHLSHYQSSI